MTKTKLLISVAAIAALCLDAAELFAESPTPSPSPGAAANDLVQLTVKDEHGNERQRASHGNRVDSSFLAPGQMVELTVKFANGKKGEPVLMTSLDGGVVTLKDAASTLSGDGSVRFSYQAGNAFGAYRLLILHGPDKYDMTLYVVDADHLPFRRHVPSPH